MDEQPWKRVQLSLERPYKDDNGEPIPILLDITPDGEHIYEPKEDASKALGQNLRRIFQERGVDFFDQNKVSGLSLKTDVEEQTDDSDEQETDSETTSNAMTTEDLFKMRMEILPQLFVALGEMSHARDLLSLLLSSSAPPSDMLSSPSILTATFVNKPPPIPSVQAFDSQLAIGGKDEALRKAANVFKSAAASMERGRLRGEKYWVDALKIRRGNWGLIPAPLPYGSATGKGADKTSKDFLVSFSLEESPALFRRRALGSLPTYEDGSSSLVFPHRQHTRLRVSITTTQDSSTPTYYISPSFADDGLDASLRAAQREIVEQEIFSLLVLEAGKLPTASARVSERLIVVDAAQDVELKFELIENIENSASTTVGKCDIIYHALCALLLRRHRHIKQQRLGAAGLLRSSSTTAPPILQPIIDFLQYEVFCHRVRSELHRMIQALAQIGISSALDFDAIGEIGQELVKLLEEDDIQRIGGEAVLRIDNRHIMRLTFLSPSSLTAHLPQATLTISSIPQLCQLLSDEIERYLLIRICDIGGELCDQVDGTWFVDLVTSRTVGRWEGCVLNFCIFYGSDFSIELSAFRLDHKNSRDGKLLAKYSSNYHSSVASWVDNIIKSALRQS